MSFSISGTVPGTGTPSIKFFCILQWHAAKIKRELCNILTFDWMKILKMSIVLYVRYRTVTQVKMRNKVNFWWIATVLIQCKYVRICNKIKYLQQRLTGTGTIITNSKIRTYVLLVQKSVQLITYGTLHYIPTNL